MSQPPPIPVEPLQYSMIRPTGRPGLLTAVGIISVVLGCITILTSLSGVFTAIGFMMMSKVTIPAGGPMVAPPPAGVGSQGTVSVGGISVSGADYENGMQDPLKSVALTALAGGRGMNAERVRQADLLLTASGQAMFPTLKAGMTPMQLRSNITESGRLPSASGGPGPDYFIIGTGRVEVYDDHATFRPDGSADVVSVSANDDADSTVAPTSPAGTGTGNFTSSFTVTGPGGTTTTTTTRGGAPVMPNFRNLSTGAISTSLVVSAASFVVALLLLIAGILMLRDSRLTVRMHWIYVIAKIPLVIVSIIASSIMMSSFMTTMFTATGGPAPNTGAAQTMMIVFAVMGGAMALVYPIALIFVLRSRTARDYFDRDPSAY